MSKVIIFIAPDTPENRKAAERVQKSFAAAKMDADIKTGREGSIQDITASDIVIVGVDGQANGNHPDFKEINRALSGINLAGRVAGVLSFDTGSPDKDVAVTETISKIFKDSEITFAHDPLIVKNGHADAKKLTEWIETIITMHKEGHDAE